MATKIKKIIIKKAPTGRFSDLDNFRITLERSGKMTYERNKVPDGKYDTSKTLKLPKEKITALFAEIDAKGSYGEYSDARDGTFKYTIMMEATDGSNIYGGDTFDRCPGWFLGYVRPINNMILESGDKELYNLIKYQW